MGLEIDIATEYTPARLFFSNSLENLFSALRENLFSADSSPFSKRLLIVPSQAMEGWVRMRLAEELGIAAGITTGFLDQAVHQLFEMEPFPSKLELTLLIEQELDQMKEQWEALNTYLQKSEKRTVLLAKQLASLFIRYGIYGHSACSRWEREPKSWQEELWRRLFIARPYPLKMLPTLKTRPTEATIHLFAFSHIPPLYFHFFQQLPSVHFYQLSPCQEFWSDLSVEHPLLTHFGRVGGEMARLIEESEVECDELYRLPEKKTQLHALQRELLNLETYEKIEDESLELHQSVTEYHEIQNLHNTLVELLNSQELDPKEILVMAPDITRYEPYIRATFQRGLAYQIADMPLQQKDPQVEGLFLLLDLEKRRFSAPALLELFQHPLFQRKIGWNDEDLLQIREWIEATGIRWGLDRENRDALLKQRQCEKGMQDGGATWKAGIDHLLEELALPHTPTRIDFTQAELLGEWKELLDKLAADLTLLHERLTLRAWVDRLQELHESYFSDSDHVIHNLENLAKAGRTLTERLYPFEVIANLLHEVIGQKSMTVHANQLQAVRFCSMLPMRAIPAKVICLIGMNHDAFPRQESLFSLDMLKNQGDYTPSRLDFDRYLFLEALLSARKKLIISYLECDPFDRTPWPPSSVISQLLPYISKRVRHPVYTPPEEEQTQPALFAYHPPKIEIPPCRLDISELIRPFRSPLRYYLSHRDIYVREERLIQEEEAFQLSPLRKAILRQAGEGAFKKAKREGDFPIGPFALLAEKQLREELEALPKDYETLPVDLMVGKVQIVGSLDGVLPGTLLIYEKKNLKGAARNWPLFLLLTALRPSTRSLLFGRENKRVERFFDDPGPYLKAVLHYYFLAQKIPSPLYPDWVEAILRENPAKLEKAPVYDGALRWALRGQKTLSSEAIVTEWKEEAEKLFKEMADAWF